MSFVSKFLRRDNKKLILLSEAAQFSPYSQAYLNLRARQRKLRATKVGRDWFTTREWLDEYIRKTERAKVARARNMVIPSAGDTRVLRILVSRLRSALPDISKFVMPKLPEIPKRRFVVGLGVFLLVVVSVVAFASVQARPHKVNLYFSECEGEWESPAFIEGEPDVGSGGDEGDFNSQNSARYTSGLFGVECGELEEIPSGRVKSRRLGLSLAVLSEAPIAERLPVPEEPEGVPTEEAIEEPVEVPVEEPVVEEVPPKGEEKVNRIPPRARATVNTEEADAGEVLTFDASGSRDVDSDVLFYSWNFGDGVRSKEKIATHSYSEPGTYDVVLLVSDGELESYGFLTITIRGEEESLPEGDQGGSIFVPFKKLLLSSFAIAQEPTSTEVLPTSTDEVIPTEEDLPIEVLTEEDEEVIELPTSTPPSPEATEGQGEEILPAEEEAPSIEGPVQISPEGETEAGKEPITLPERLLQILISLDKGETWDPVGTVDQIPFSNKDVGGYLMFDLSQSLFSYERRIEDIQIRIEGLTRGDVPIEIFVDSVWVEVMLTDPREALLETEREEFAQNEKPKFRVRVEDPQTFLDLIGNLNPFQPPEDKIDVSLTWSLLDPRGRVVGEVPIEFTPLIAATEDEAEWEITVSPLNTFRPGRYTFAIQAVDEEWNVLEVEKEFTWGLLAINTPKSVYLPADDVELDFLVLDERGVRICDAYLELRITDPEGSIEEFSTASGSIRPNALCREGAESSVLSDYSLSLPDYSALWRAGIIPGGYQLELIADFTNSDGRDEVHRIKDTFTVQDSVTFDIKRSGPTRVLPGRTYEMRMQIITKRRSYSGPLIEHLPPGFTVSDIGWRKIITESDFGLPFTQVEPYEASFIQWNVEFDAGGIYELGYSFQVPDDIPQFWLLGPLAFFRDSGGLVPSESLDVRREPFRVQASEALDAFSTQTDNISLGSEDPKVPSIINAENVLFAESRFWQITSAYLERPIKPKVLLTDSDLLSLGIATFEKTDFRIDEEPTFSFIAEPVLDIDTLVAEGEAEILNKEEIEKSKAQKKESEPAAPSGSEPRPDRGREEPTGLFEEPIETIQEEAPTSTEEILPTEEEQVEELPISTQEIVPSEESPTSTEEFPTSTEPESPVSRLDLETSTMFRGSTSKHWLLGLFGGFFDTDEAFAKRHLNIQAKIISPDGSETTIRPQISTFTEKGKDKFGVTLPKPGRSFRPGKYTLELEWETENQILVVRQDFTWGVLAINVNKSIYTPGERAYIQMGVLDDRGRTICDAALNLKIKSPSSRVTTLSTKDGSIQYSGECAGNTVVAVPDYFGYYGISDEIGLYEMTISATTKNGTRSITDIFEVRESVPFAVERIGPTRIYPPEPYSMKFKIHASDDFRGEVKELIPESFTLVSFESGKVASQKGAKIITWEVDWKKGETHELKYTFDASDISPEFYLLGPLEFSGSPGFIKQLFGPDIITIFKEARHWQIAADIPVVAGEDIIASSGFNTVALLSKKAFQTDPEARHNCSVTPFSRKIQAGKQATFTIKLEADQTLPFGMRFGNLPNGVQASWGSIQQGAKARIPLTITTDVGAQSGSFNIPLAFLIKDGSVFVSTVCQLNLVIQTP